MRVSIKWVVLWSLWAARLARQPAAPVRTRSGLVRGSLAADGSHVAYLSIPYATLTREHRFKAPGPEPKWDGVFEAVNENIKCTQRFSDSRILGQEDCLVLNVYTPLQASNPLPVLFFIHGGGFRDGSGSPFLYGPDYLVKHDVILVSINYRLDVLGFLCLGTEDAPGNAGLKDQVAALKWVKRNIRAFGGDPDNITIFGESAGSASVAYHLVSPMSYGLFNKAIMQSGSAIYPWGQQFEPLKIAKTFTRQFGHNTDDPNEIYKILMGKSGGELLRTRVPKYKGELYVSELRFVPCVENKLPGIEQFLPDSPLNLLSEGKYQKVPIIIGYNNAEGYFFAAKDNDTTIENVDLYKALPRDLVIPDEQDKLDIVAELRQLYFGDKKISKDTIHEIARYEGDTAISYPVLATIDLLLQTSTKPIFGYRLDYDGWLNVAKLQAGFGSSPGATHADDLFYMFKPRFPTAYFLERDKVDTVTRMWTNFAKFGDPTPSSSSNGLQKWAPLSRAEPLLHVIDSKPHQSPLWADDAMRFWNKTYSKFRRKYSPSSSYLP